MYERKSEMSLKQIIKNREIKGRQYKNEELHNNVDNDHCKQSRAITLVLSWMQIFTIQSNIAMKLGHQTLFEVIIVYLT